jgi:hypothetical protein
MADDKKNGNDAGDSTRQQPLHPPIPKPAQPQGAPPDAAKPGGGEHTVIGGGPPAMPKPPAAPAGGGQGHTLVGGAPPAMPKPPGAAAPAAPRPAGGEAEEEGTVILARSTQTSCSLQRLQPAGHGAEVVTLTQDSYVMGRSRNCDIQLYSPSASRQHARLVRRAGAWYLEPEEGRTVLAGGSTVKGEVRLVHKMRLQLGGDELLFFDEGGGASAAPAATGTGAAPSQAKGSRTGLIVGIAIAVLVLAAAALWLFLKP